MSNIERELQKLQNFETELESEYEASQRSQLEHTERILEATRMILEQRRKINEMAGDNAETTT